MVRWIIFSVVMLAVNACSKRGGSLIGQKALEDIALKIFLDSVYLKPHSPVVTDSLDIDLALTSDSFEDIWYTNDTLNYRLAIIEDVSITTLPEHEEFSLYDNRAEMSDSTYLESVGYLNDYHKKLKDTTVYKIVLNEADTVIRDRNEIRKFLTDGFIVIEVCKAIRSHNGAWVELIVKWEEDDFENGCKFRVLFDKRNGAIEWYLL